MADLERLLSEAKRALGDTVMDSHIERGELSILIPRTRIAEVLRTLRDDQTLAFHQLMDICGVDYPERPERFEVVYNLLSLKHNWRIRIKLHTDETSLVPSVVKIYSAAGWYERECWDLYGVAFSGNPDLRRILTDYGFEGHPLRKDFPLTGYVEVRYDETQKRVIYEPVQLPQDFRSFDFLSPWEGMTDINMRTLPGDEKATPKPETKQ
jgi:NADH-quinone oxidoreductase subunit C